MPSGMLWSSISATPAQPPKLPSIWKGECASSRLGQVPPPRRASPCHPERSEGSHHGRTFLDVVRCISPEVAGEVEALIEELGLEFFGKVERVEVEEDLPP